MELVRDVYRISEDPQKIFSYETAAVYVSCGEMSGVIRLEFEDEER